MLERLFQLAAHGTNARREIVAGLTAFAAMAFATNCPMALAPGMG